nr:MAG TPA: Large Terminase [Caudoviricetes sp.]
MTSYISDIDMSNLKELRKKHPESWLLEYIDKCKSGEILIGQELMLELDIHLALFDDSDTRFETEDAHKRIKFIETHCRHYEAPFAGKPFILTLRQKAFVEALYSFKIFDDELGRWVRLYQEALMMVSRKCGKTPFVAALILAEFFCGELGTKALCSSNDYDQAALMFDAINAMREESPALEKVTRKNIKGIFFGNPKKPKKRGKFSYQNKGNIKKISAKTGAKEGKNIKVGAADEVHELEDNSSIMPIRQALSTQDEPLYFEITTEGFTDNGYLDGRLKEARQVLKGELPRRRWLIWLFTQDSEAEIWQDEKTWVKSNPDIGTIKKWSFLRQMVEEAKTNSATRAFVLAKDFNIKQAGGAAWLQDAEIINPATFSIEDFRGSYYIAGNDFAETTDLCASKLLLMKPGKPEVYFWSHYWIPAEKLKNSPDDADYEQWARDGYLTIVKGGSVDSSIVADWQWSMYQDFGLIPYKSGYDNRFAKDYLRRYEEYFGKDSEAVNVPQDAKCLNNPMRRLESDLRHNLVNYNNRYGDFWCFRNMGIKTDNAERIQPCKLKTTHRIDGGAAAIDCYAVFEWYKSEFLTLIGG